IAIPTYNRNRFLVETVQRLLPQLSAACRLLIIDNCSDEPAAEALRPVIGAETDAPVRIVRNGVNVGAIANIMRCFELCETEWMWLLGDDDRPEPDAVSTILAHIRSQPAALFFNFVCSNLGGNPTREE